MHDPLGGGAYAFQDDLVGPLLDNLVNDEFLSADGGSEPNRKGKAARGMPTRPIIIHAGAQPNNSQHCGTLIVFCYAFAVASAIRDRMQAAAAANTTSNTQTPPPPVSVEITLVDTAPVKSESLTINNISYQRSHRDTPNAMAAFTSDYHEVLTHLSTWSTIPFTTTLQSTFFSHPSMPPLLHYTLTNHPTLARQLSPKHHTLALRAACPVAACALAEKHGKLNTYHITPSPATSSITFHCPRHGPHTLPLTQASRLEANAPTRNLLRSMTHLLDREVHHVRVTGADYAGMYQEAMLYRPLAEWAASYHKHNHNRGDNGGGVDDGGGGGGLGGGGINGRTPHILYAPLVVDWSGAKLSKSPYVRDGGYERMELFGTDGLAAYGVLKARVGGEEGLGRIWREVVGWVADPRKVFRCFSVGYLRRVVMEGRGWEETRAGETEK